MAIYIHIPFCSSICSYCDFCKIIYNKKYISDYLDNLENEIKLKYDGRSVTSIYIGGGTPTSLSDDEFMRLLEITKLFNIASNYEFTIECNVSSLTLDKLKLMKKYGVNRISIGVESFDSDILKVLGRDHDGVAAKEKIRLAKKYFDNINIDLIYAVNERINVVKNDVSEALSLDIQHLSFYSLILEEHTLLKINGHKNISEDLDYEMYKYIDDELAKNNYIHYEISNYAKDGYFSKHNLVYWNNDEYMGFGLSSVGYYDNKRYFNTHNLSKYLKGEYLDYFEEEDIRVRMENEIMLGLRKLSGIDINFFKEKYDIDLLGYNNVLSLIEDGYLVYDGNNLRISSEYIYTSNEIIVRIIGTD